jgi:uncharacterized membrane protein YfcA
VEPALAPNAAFAGVLVVVTLAAAVKSALGFGFPLISVPIAANLIGARQAVLLIAVPVVVTNVAILLRGGGTREQLRRFAGLLAGVVAGTVAGSRLLGTLDPRWVALAVGAAGMLFALVSLLDLTPAIPPRAQAYAGPLVGGLSGVMGGTTGIFAPLIAAYIHSLGVDKRAFVYWLTASFLLGGLTQVATYYRLGLYTPTIALYAAAACVPALLGTRLGFWVQDRLSAEGFRRGVLLLVLASSLNLILRALR